MDLLAHIRRAVQGSSSGAQAPPHPAVEVITPARILLAEDNIVNQRVAIGLLQKRGHMSSRWRGTGARRSTRSGARPSTLSSWTSRCRRWGASRRRSAIREHEAATGGHVRIVAMTAHAMSGDRDRCLAAGMDGYLSKPIQQALLFQVVEQGSEGDVSVPPAAIDAAGLLARVGGDQDLMRDVVRLFLEDCPVRLAAIRAAIIAGDMDGLRNAAHALRGAAGTLSASGLVEAASVLERIGAEKRTEAVEAAWKTLNAQAAQLAAALQTMEGAAAYAR